jgi:fructose-1-phosphate kinase PfkB-like protein
VGSGDSFLGGLLTALGGPGDGPDDGPGDGPSDLAAALRLATATGAANALVAGAGRLDLAALAELRDRVRITIGRTGSAGPVPQVRDVR